MNIKIQNLTITAITFMNKTKNLQNERFDCPFLKVRTNIQLRTKRLVRAIKRTSTCNGLVGRHTSIVSPLKIQKIFLNMVEIIFSKHKDPRIER